MALSKRDSEFRLPRISYLEFKFTDMDRVLTAFFARLWHGGHPSRLTRNFTLEIDTFVEEVLAHPDRFQGFADHRDILERWLRTHLMDMVNRGQGDKEAVAAPRPLHGFTYRLRNPKHSRDYGTSQQLYEMLYYARGGADALDQLKAFFFPGIDPVTHQQNQEGVDVETQALLHLPMTISDAADTTQRGHPYPPVCLESATLLAEDIKSLFFYQSFIPRSVMVDYLKILFSFHLAIYHLRLLKLIPELVKRQGAPTGGQAPYPIGLLVDVANRPDTPMAALAETSADVHFRRIPNFVKAHYALRKLDEFSKHLVKLGKLSRQSEEQLTVGEVAALQGAIYKGDLEPFFKQRLAGLLEDSDSNSEELDRDTQAIVGMDLPPFETYIEILTALRGQYHRRYITECLDSLLLKNRPGALLAQARTRNAPRRFILDSRLLEVLLQIAVLRPGGHLGFHSAPLRIDELLHWLRTRYGLYIDQLPEGDGFGPAGITDRQALQDNRRAFTSRLREVGFYRDLSDAYISQTVTPRYEIGLDASSVN
ncbi:MAG: methylation-associated defense system protein MAD7 [Nodosilinea sp.]